MIICHAICHGVKCHAICHLICHGSETETIGSAYVMRYVMLKSAYVIEVCHVICHLICHGSGSERIEVRICHAICHAAISICHRTLSCDMSSHTS